MAGDGIQRRADLVCERRGDLTDRRQPFGARQPLLRLKQSFIRGAQFMCRLRDFVPQLIVEAVDLRQ